MGPSGEPERIRVRDGAVAWREVDGEIILMDVASSRYLGVNRTGTVLWPALIEGTTRDELVERLVARYGVDAGQAGTDVDAFLTTCGQQDLLES